jgi:hypothetical protein
MIVVGILNSIDVDEKTPEKEERLVNWLLKPSRLTNITKLNLVS